MSAAVQPAGITGGSGPLAGAMRAARRDPWMVGLWGLFIGLLAFTKLIQPSYDANGLASLAIAALPVAFAAIAQAVVVISGGIDLSVGSVMALTSVIAAALMTDGSPESAILVVAGVLAIGVVIGVVNGALVVFSRVPDIVVTLAMLYVWAGVALLILDRPGGGVADWLADLARGSLIVEWVPRAFVLLVVVVAVIWLPLRRTRLGLSIYAVGSHQLAAFRSGVDVPRTRIAAYVLAGLFAACGGLALTMTTGIGTPIPGPYLLQSVAAIVLGGVSLAGGRGNLVGPIVAVYILSLLRTDLTFLHVDPNLTTVLQGAIMVVVVMIGAYLTLRRNRPA